MTSPPRIERLRRRAVRRSVLGTVLSGCFVVLGALGASAHVTVTPSTAAPGSSTELSFRVPNEEAGADTTRIDLLIPTQHPIAQLLAKPLPGWTITEKTTKLAKPLVTDDGSFSSVVSEVTWSGGRIGPGQFEDFVLSADPLPDEPMTLVFKALQTYSNGDVVRRIDVAQPGQAEPEHPAPVLTITKNAETDGAGGMSGMAGMGNASGRSSDSGVNTSTGSSGSATTLAIIALVVAVIALGGTAWSWLRRPKPKD